MISIRGNLLKRQAFISRDAIQMTGLVGKFWSLKPDVLSKKGPLIYCNVIKKCCSDEHRSQAMSIFASVIKLNDMDTNLTEFLDIKCINSSTFDNENQWCSSYQSLVKDDPFVKPDAEDPDIKQYSIELQEYSVDVLEIMKNAHSTCTGEELYSFICLSNKKLMRTCTVKVLQKFYDYNGYKVYQQYVQKTKYMLVTLNQKLSKIFKNKTKTV